MYGADRRRSSELVRALHRDLFVQSIQVTVTRERDGARHGFGWESFRAGHAGVSGENAIQIPAGFLVLATQPARFNVFFADFDTRQEVQTLLRPVQEAWNAKVAEASPADEEERSALYQVFTNEPPVYTAHAAIDRLLYWTQGEYRLELRVLTSRPDNAFMRNGASHFRAKMKKPCV